MSTLKYDNDIYTQTHLMIDRKVYTEYKKYVKDNGMSPTTLIDYFSDEYLTKLIDKIENDEKSFFNLIKVDKNNRKEFVKVLVVFKKEIRDKFKKVCKSNSLLYRDVLDTYTEQLINDIKENIENKTKKISSVKSRRL